MINCIWSHFSWPWRFTIRFKLARIRCSNNNSFRSHSCHFIFSFLSCDTQNYSFQSDLKKGVNVVLCIKRIEIDLPQVESTFAPDSVFPFSSCYLMWFQQSATFQRWLENKCHFWPYQCVLGEILFWIGQLDSVQFWFESLECHFSRHKSWPKIRRKSFEKTIRKTRLKVSITRAIQYWKLHKMEGLKKAWKSRNAQKAHKWRFRNSENFQRHKIIPIFQFD